MAERVDEREAHFLAVIAANPEDAQAREVYADWLDARGDPRGEYIRLEAHFHSIPARLAQLASAIDPAWLNHIGRRYDVLLVSGGANKIGVIKVVREVTRLGLKDAKDLVDAAARGPSRVMVNLERDAAQRIEHQLRAAGATAHFVARGGTVRGAPTMRGVVVMLVSVVPDQRLAAVNLVRETRSCGLREAVRFVDLVIAGTPSPLLPDVSMNRASELIATFAAVGVATATPS